jgi:hypothetical protein
MGAKDSDPNSVSIKALLKCVLIDGAIRTAVSTGVGALAELAVVVVNFFLFVASPLIGPLAMLGWGASVDGFIGGAAGARSNAGKKECNLSLWSTKRYRAVKSS